MDELIKGFVKNAGSLSANYIATISQQMYKLILTAHEPADPSCLGVVRALFGLMMVIDIPDERGLHNIDTRFGDPLNCHFPLFHWWSQPSFEVVTLLYLCMWLGAAGLCLGFKHKLTSLMFIIPYWYIFLLDKTSWNNHSYLYGLLAILFLFTSANHSFSVDSILDRSIREKPVPKWNYWILRFQMFLLYFYAGLKKFDPDWIGGHSMVSLSKHWVFQPFRFVLEEEQIDFWIVHLFGFIFDLTVGFWLLWGKTRPIAIMFATMFHLMNSRLFQIGQFPYVCLATTPIFCEYDWPRGLSIRVGQAEGCKKTVAKDTEKKTENPTLKQIWTVILLSLHVSCQLFLPYSHWLTKGYNNWTNGLYGYSWDMMVHSWDTTLITVTLEDNRSGQQRFLDPNAWVRNTRYSKHADMLVQYASCIKNNLEVLGDRDLANNVSIYIDVWCSLNHRFQQRMFDPKVNLLTAEWSPWIPTKWLMPLLSELTPWRSRLLQLQSEVWSWSKNIDVLFLADFPGLEFEHYIMDELQNVTLTVLEGEVFVESSKSATSLSNGGKMKIDSGQIHKIRTTSSNPSCIVYTYQNSTYSTNEGNQDSRIYGPVIELSSRLKDFQLSLKNLRMGLGKLYTRLFYRRS